MSKAGLADTAVSATAATNARNSMFPGSGFGSRTRQTNDGRNEIRAFSSLSVEKTAVDGSNVGKCKCRQDLPKIIKFGRVFSVLPSATADFSFPWGLP